MQLPFKQTCCCRRWSWGGGGGGGGSTECLPAFTPAFNGRFSSALQPGSALLFMPHYSIMSLQLQKCCINASEADGSHDHFLNQTFLCLALTATSARQSHISGVKRPEFLLKSRLAASGRHGFREAAKCTSTCGLKGSVLRPWRR